MLLEQLEGLGVDDGLDHLVEGLPDDARHLAPGPSPTVSFSTDFPDPSQLLLARPEVEVDELRGQGPPDRPWPGSGRPGRSGGRRRPSTPGR